MKKYLGFIFGLIVAGLGFSACNNDAIDDLQGVYGDMQIYQSNEATVQPTTKLGRGIKSLNVDIKDAQGNDVTVNFGSSEWILPSATYAVSNTVANKTCVVKVNGEAMQSGDLDVTIYGGVYYFSGLFTNQAGKRVKLDYHGNLTFEVGVDDPEASGYTFSIATSPVVMFDWTTGQTTVFPDVTKYVMTVKNPTGNVVASLEAVNSNNLQAEGLVGTYTIQGSSTEPWLMDYGYAMPDYDAFGGSYFVDDAGNKQYIASGNVVIETAKDAEGMSLFTFSGSDLGTVDVTGTAGKGNFSVKFASVEVASSQE